MPPTTGETITRPAAAQAAYEETAPPRGEHDLTALRQEVTCVLAGRDVTFSGEPFTIDPVPRVIAADEWDELARGLKQRVRALAAFIADVYGERRIVAAGVVPARVIETAEYHEPAMRGARMPAAGPIAVAGLDVVRDETGRFLVLEDNVRTPSGLAYAVAAREALERCLRPARPLTDVRRGFELLGAALRAAAGVPDPLVVLLTDGPSNSAWYEHRAIARRSRIPLVRLEDLHPRDGALFTDVRGEWERVDVVYRRTDEDRLDSHVGRVLRDGGATVVNAFGAGVADDKLAHAYVEDMIRFYLGEEPLIGSVPTFDLGDPAVRRRVLDRLDELVVKPRAASGGDGILIGPHAHERDCAATAEAVEADPDAWVAQEMVRISCHPTVVDGRLEPRHVDLRAFVFVTGDEVAVLPGGLTRVALERGSLVVNSSQGGGAKDTWVAA